MTLKIQVSKQVNGNFVCMPLLVAKPLEENMGDFHRIYQTIKEQADLRIMAFVQRSVNGLVT